MLRCKNKEEEFTKHIIYNDDAGQIIGINLDKLLSPLSSHEIGMVCSYAEGILTGKRLEEEKKMVKFEFYLSEEFFDRMAVAKKKAGKEELTYNEYAKELLEKELYRLQSRRPTQEELEDC